MAKVVVSAEFKERLENRIQSLLNVVRESDDDNTVDYEAFLDKLWTFDEAADELSELNRKQNPLLEE